MCAISLPSTRVVTFNITPWTIWTTVDTGDAVVGEIRLLVEVLERVEAKKVQVPLISILLEVANLNSERDRS